jgi:hypothetical protein
MSSSKVYDDMRMFILDKKNYNVFNKNELTKYKNYVLCIFKIISFRKFIIVH